MGIFDTVLKQVVTDDAQMVTSWVFDTEVQGVSVLNPRGASVVVNTSMTSHDHGRSYSEH